MPSAKLVLTTGAERNGNAALPVIMPDPKDGNDGKSAWTPMLAIEEDGTARYLKVVDWAGGTGTKPALGYFGTDGVGTKAKASNLNALKRVTSMSAVTDATGKATFSFAGMMPPAFAKPPQVVVSSLFTNAVAVTARPKVGGTTVTTTGATIIVEQVGIVGGLVSLLVGATVTIIIIET
jgi:hypothetical protein